MSSLRSVRTILQPLFLVIALIAVGLVLERQWDALARYQWHVHTAWLPLSALLIVVGWLIEIGLWRRLIVLLGGDLGYWPAVSVWTASALVRYVPGNIWQPLSMTMLGRDRGMRAEVTLASLSLFHVVHVLAVGIVA